ncbi:MAG: lysophospholipid acyltransferase family protein [Rariglobus sp.]
MSTPSRPTEINGLRGWRRCALQPLGLLMRLWGRSLHLEASPEAVRNLSKIDEPVAFTLWHNRLFITAEIFRRYRQGRPIYGLVSPSKDGAWLEAFFSLVGIRAVRGSSNKLGREAVTALVEVMKAGNDIGITPDGPRGPIYEFKAGGLIVARRVQAPLLLLGCSFEKSWQLRSWDRFHLPRPFSRIRVYCELVPSNTLGDREASARELEARLLKMSPDPDARLQIV